MQFTQYLECVSLNDGAFLITPAQNTWAKMKR
jgi:hypothetical protein